MAALHRAVALTEVDDVAVTVAEDLELDVARPREVLLDVDVAVAECRQRLAARELERARKSSASVATRMPLPPPPAAALMITGKPISRANAERFFDVFDAGPGVPGTIGTPTACMALRAAALSPITRICAPSAR